MKVTLQKIRSPGKVPFGAYPACAKREAYPDPPQAAYTEALLHGPELFSGPALFRSGPDTVLLLYWKCGLSQSYCKCV